MHDRLLELLLSLADVRLVARLRDERLGYPYTDDLRVFIPDLHLISNRRRIEGRYTCTTNHTGLAAELFGALRRLKTQSAENETVAVYVLGDFLDLWREGRKFSKKRDPAAAIRASHSSLVEAALHPALKTRFLLGNHDFDLYRWPAYRAWDRRYYLPLSADCKPSVILLHGDLFAWIEQFSDRIQQLLVYYFAPLHSPNDHQLGEVARFAKKEHRNRKYRECFRDGGPVDLGVLCRADSISLPTSSNVHRPGEASASFLQYLEPARLEVQRRNLAHGLDLRVAFIGHTHHARIAVHEAADEFFALVDCGAWIESCSYAERDGSQVSLQPNAQIGALSDNEVRLYQLSPRG